MTRNVTAAVESKPSPEFSHLIVVAASAGGLEALKELLAPLPADFPGAIVVVQHRSEGSESRLAHLLQRHTALRVMENGHNLDPGVVHLAPAGVHYLVQADGTVEQVEGPRVRFHRPSADLLFESAAQHFGKRVIAVVLSGADADGSAGVQAVKSAGGTAFAQSKDSSVIYQMPHSAIKTGGIDHVLTAREIGQMLAKIVKEKDE